MKKAGTLGGFRLVVSSGSAGFCRRLPAAIVMPFAVDVAFAMAVVAIALLIPVVVSTTVVGMAVMIAVTMTVTVTVVRRHDHRRPASGGNYHGGRAGIIYHWRRAISRGPVADDHRWRHRQANPDAEVNPGMRCGSGAGENCCN
jgi:hypothetical protein